MPVPAGAWIFLFSLATIAAAVWGTYMLLPVNEWLAAA